MGFYSVAGRTAATAAAADQSVAGVWNPSTTRRARVYEIGWYKTDITGSGQLRIQRTTARGTATVTATPDADNAWDANDTPPSALVLDTTYSAQPTLAALPALTGNRPSTSEEGVGFVWIFSRGIEILNGGLAIVTGTATAMPASDVYVVWEEG